MSDKSPTIENRILFGTAEGRADKALISCRSERIPNAYECHILEVGGNYQIGDGVSINSKDIVGERQILTFCKRSSLQSMIKNLQALDKIWEEDIENGYEWNIPENRDKLSEDFRESLNKLVKNLTPEGRKAAFEAVKEFLKEEDRKGE